jgi:hypothetical protein
VFILAAISAGAMSPPIGAPCAVAGVRARRGLWGPRWRFRRQVGEGGRAVAPARWDSPPTRYWQMVRSQFLLSPRGVYFNTGTVGASPRPVVDAVVQHLRAFETVFDARGFDGAALKRDVAALVGAPTQTLVFTRNTTEAMNYVANGSSCAGDGILATTHDTSAASVPNLVARRRLS